MLGKLLLVVNPCAGQRRATKQLAGMIRLFYDHGWDTTVFITACKDDALNYVSARAAEYGKIVCIGGDGTLNEVISGLLKSGADVPIGYIPAGTTNDYATTLGLSKNMLDAAKDAVCGVEQKIDIGDINGRYFAYTASFGLFTKTAYSTPQSAKNLLGHMAYVLAGIKEVSQIRPIHVKLQADGREIEDDFLFGAVNNSTSVGGMLKLNSGDVGLDDGVFEVLLIKHPKNANQLAKTLKALLQSDFSSPTLYFFNAAHITMEIDPDVRWTRDGEYEDGAQIMRIENLHRAVRFTAPANSPLFLKREGE